MPDGLEFHIKDKNFTKDVSIERWQTEFCGYFIIKIDKVEHKKGMNESKASVLFTISSSIFFY